MQRLGYDHWVAQGGDWGSFITYCIGMLEPEGCRGIHLNMPIGGPTAEARANPTPEEKRALERMQYYNDWDSGYSKQQQTRPQSVGYGLVDSPVGLAGWIYEKLHGWSDNAGDACALLGRDAVLDNIMLYWLPATGASAARLYWESFARIKPGEINLPAGISVFPGEITPSPRGWVERRMKNIVHWNELDRGGHFAAWEQPELFVDELRRCFAPMR
jgi:pimeloyl-ACP methyl ester carboxylesterase